MKLVSFDLSDVLSLELAAFFSFINVKQTKFEPSFGFYPFFYFAKALKCDQVQFGKCEAFSVRSQTC